MQKTRQAILVEGYFDVIRLSQEGVKNTVASLGTSFSKSHASLLKRFVDEVFIVFDGDSAGLRASYKAAIMSLPFLTPKKFLQFVVIKRWNRVKAVKINPNSQGILQYKHNLLIILYLLIKLLKQILVCLQEILMQKY